MSAYGTLTLPSALYPGDSFACINAEASSGYTSGTPAERVALGNSQVGATIPVSLELTFSANPGTFSIALQTADSDVSGAYQYLSSGTNTITSASQTGGAGSYYARLEAQVASNFARPYVITQTQNACNITAKITRH